MKGIDKMFCFHHDYELIDKEIGESMLEQLERLCCKYKGDIHHTMSEKKLSRVFKCKKCGKIWISNTLI